MVIGDGRGVNMPPTSAGLPQTPLHARCPLPARRLTREMSLHRQHGDCIVFLGGHARATVRCARHHGPAPGGCPCAQLPGWWAVLQDPRHRPSLPSCTLPAASPWVSSTPSFHPPSFPLFHPSILSSFRGGLLMSVGVSERLLCATPPSCG